VKRAIFISYRRDDAEGEAGRLYDDLVRAYGDDSVFMDVAGIAPGLDFRKAIDDNVSGCGVFLAIIGSQWATITGANGQRRLEDDNDFVRLEISSALTRNIAVIPVLVHDARMPRPEQLPDNIKDLAYRNSVEISHARWNSDVQLLVEALKQYVQTTRATQTEPVHATVSVQLPPPVSPHPVPEVQKSKMPLIAGGIAGALVLLGVIAFAVFHKTAAPQPTPPAASAAATTNAPTTMAAASNPGAIAGLAGNWRCTRVKKVGDGVDELRITGAAPSYQMEIMGNCPQGECSWGTQPLTFNGGQAVTTWSPRATKADTAQNRTAVVTLRPAGANLDMYIQNSWTGPDGQPKQNGLNFEFVREP
jgi:hypothetical protein